jgi:hypothetical protein
MTDIERFVDLYKSFGIDLNVCDDTDDINEGGFIIKLSSKDKAFGGYLYLYSTVKFDKDGKFIKQFFWE